MSYRKSYLTTAGVLTDTSNSFAPASTYYDGVFRKFRLEWVNYLLAGTRTHELRLYVDGVLTSTASSAAGAARWVHPPALVIAGYESFQTMKNIKIGSPVLPAKALPEPY